MLHRNSKCTSRRVVRLRRLGVRGLSLYGGLTEGLAAFERMSLRTLTIHIGILMGNDLREVLDGWPRRRGTMHG